MHPLTRPQERAIDFALDRPGANIFARPGRGKTRIALNVIDATLGTLNGRALVIAPLFPALTVWPAEIKKWGFDFDYRVLHGKEKRIGNEQLTIINYDGLVWFSQNADLSEYAIVVYDEIHKMKHPGTSRFRSWRSATKKIPYRLGLTGTPMNKLMDLWAQQFIIDGGQTLGHAKYKYEDAYFTLDRSSQIRNNWLPRPGVEDEIFEAIKPTALALDFDDGEMPPLTLNPIKLTLPKKVRDVYTEMHDSSEWADGNTMAVNAGVRSQKLRQIAAGRMYDDQGEVIKLHNEKIKRLQALVEELQGDPILVFYEFWHSHAALSEAFPLAPSLNGRTKSTDMANIVEAWNLGAHPVLLAHPATAGEGGNMQESGNTLAWYDTPWSLKSVEQGIGRVWRPGQERSVIAHFLLIDDTKDIDVYDSIGSKASMQDQLFDTLSAP